jgi:hypothetical protein
MFTVAPDKPSFFLFLTIPLNVAVVTWEKIAVVLKIMNNDDSIDRRIGLLIAVGFGLKR